MRKALELLTTAHPASANFGSSSRAMPASSAAKITRGAPSGPAGDTCILRTRSGIGVFKRQRTASPYGLSCRAVGRGQPRHFEPGMVFEQLDEALTDNSGCAENSDGNFLLRHDL